MRGDESNLDAHLGADREGMEGVASLKRTVGPGFAHSMTFEQGHEKVREQTTEHLREEHSRQREQQFKQSAQAWC